MSANSLTANVLFVDYVPTVNKHLSIVYLTELKEREIQPPDLSEPFPTVFSLLK